MKLFILILLFPFNVSAASWCDIKVRGGGALLTTYEGVCDQSKFGGDWGDSSKTTHSANLTKQNDIDAALSAEATKLTNRNTRIARLKTACGPATGIQKDICDQILEFMGQ